MKKLTLLQIEEGRKLIIENAKSLIEEAEILLRHKKFARCYAISKLAQEELGKIFVLDGMAYHLTSGGTEKEWNDLWVYFRKHKIKSFLIKIPFLAGLYKEKPTAENLGYFKVYAGRPEVEEFLKLGAFYVDFRNGKFYTPLSGFGEELAIEYLAETKKLCVYMEDKVCTRPLADQDGKPTQYLMELCKQIEKAKQNER